MPQPQLFKSKFVKADMRSSGTGDGFTVQTSVFDGVARLQDVYLSPGASFRPDAGFKGGCCYVLPIAGQIRFAGETETQSLVPGDLYTISESALAAAELSNPFDDETINFVIINTKEPAAATALQAYHLPLDARNKLVAPEGQSLPVLVGVYDSRTKDRIEMPVAQGTSLCFVINGSFEIEERLAEYKDALLLWDNAELDFEALSEAAILLHIRIGA